MPTANATKPSLRILGLQTVDDRQRTGGGGGCLSFWIHEERSNSRNSRAFSWAVRPPCWTQFAGNVPPGLLPDETCRSEKTTLPHCETGPPSAPASGTPPRKTGVLNE